MRAQLFKTTLLIMLAAPAWAHDNGATCSTDAAKSPTIEAARAELKEKPKSVGVRTALADKLVGVSCYDEAVHVLEDGIKLLPNDRTLESKLKTVRSFIGEREYLNKHPVAVADSSDAGFLRLQLRCKQIGDVAACDQALLSKPNDVALWAAKGDAFLKEKRPKEALAAFNRAKQLSAGSPGDVDVSARINAAQTQLALVSPPSIAQAPKVVAAPPPVVRTASVAAPPPPRYSNIEPASRSN